MLRTKTALLIAFLAHGAQQVVSNVNAALYHHQLNAPSASSRVWDAIYESDGFTPATTAVQ